MTWRVKLGEQVDFADFFKLNSRRVQTHVAANKISTSGRRALHACPKTLSRWLLLSDDRVYLGVLAARARVSFN